MAVLEADDLQVLHVKCTPRRRPGKATRAPPEPIDLDADFSGKASKRFAKVRREISTNRKKRNIVDVEELQPVLQPVPQPVDLEDEDRVIETCTSYEEAFLGYQPKVPRLPEVSAPVMVPSRLLPSHPAQSTGPQAFVVGRTPKAAKAPKAPSRGLPSSKRPRLERPSISMDSTTPSGATEEHSERSERSLVVESLTAELPKEFLVPEVEVEEKAPAEVKTPEAVDTSSKISFDEEVQEQLPAVPYSQVYVERLRNSADEEYCSVCREEIQADQLRLGYTPHTGHEARWLHVRCIADDGLQMEPGDWLAFSQAVSDEERQRVLTILSIRRPAHVTLPPLSPRLWCHSPAISQRWQRCTVPRAGAARPLSRLSPRYVAPVLSAVSQQARAVLLRERNRRLLQARQVMPPVIPLRRSGNGPSVVARRAQVTATSRRPSNQDTQSTSAPENRGRRQWHRKSALGTRAKELFAAAPVVVLEKDRSEEEPCVICHESLLAGDEVRRLPCCHTFHRSCIDRWLRLKAVCPLDKLTVDQMLSQSTCLSRPTEAASSSQS